MSQYESIALDQNGIQTEQKRKLNRQAQRRFRAKARANASNNLEITLASPASDMRLASFTSYTSPPADVFDPTALSIYGDLWEHDGWRTTKGDCLPGSLRPNALADQPPDLAYLLSPSTTETSQNQSPGSSVQCSIPTDCNISHEVVNHDNVVALRDNAQLPLSSHRCVETLMINSPDHLQSSNLVPSRHGHPPSPLSNTAMAARHPPEHMSTGYEVAPYASENADGRKRSGLSRGTTVLHTAASTGQVDMIELLTPKEITVDCVDANGATPLHLAARQGHADAVRLLLTKGADINAQDHQGYTPLHMAIAHRQSATSKLLLQNHADTSITANGGIR